MPTIITIQDSTACPRCKTLIIRAVRIEKEEINLSIFTYRMTANLKILENPRKNLKQSCWIQGPYFLKQLFLYNSNSEILERHQCTKK